MLPMTVMWATPTRRTKALIRAAAEQLLAEEAALMASMNAAVEQVLPVELREDPVLNAASRTVSEANTLQWLTSNVHAPGEVVDPYLGDEALDLARDLARRGLDEADLSSWRAALHVAWQRWVAACVALEPQPDELVELLSITHTSMTVFVDDSIERVAEAIASERDELTGGSARARLDAAALVISGAPVSLTRAEQTLGHRLSGWHLGAIAWVDSNDASNQLERAAEQVMRATGCRRRLTIAASTATLWMWLPTRREPDLRGVRRALEPYPQVRVTFGPPASDLNGFRQSHLDALTTQQVLIGLGSLRRTCTYDEIRLISALTADPARLELFVRDTLGRLAHAEPALRNTVLTVIGEQFNVARAAEQLFTHRNTVDRRLRRADDLLPRPLAENPIDIAVALRVISLRSDSDSTP